MFIIVALLDLIWYKFMYVTSCLVFSFYLLYNFKALIGMTRISVSGHLGLVVTFGVSASAWIGTRLVPRYGYKFMTNSDSPYSL